MPESLLTPVDIYFHVYIYRKSACVYVEVILESIFALNKKMKVKSGYARQS